jgi:hypothetical protein
VAVDPETGEWIWVGRVDRDGYGRFSGEGIHRIVYKLLVGPIPPGLQIDHVKAWGCTSRACLSPWHLEAVTPRENTMRSDSITALNAAKTRCIHGHLFTRANTYWWRGSRHCRACVRRRVAQYRLRVRDAAAGGQLELRPAA